MASLRITFLAAAIVVVLAPAAAVAQSRITGTVVDASGGTPLPGANVLLTDTQHGAATDEAGRFVIVDVAPGTYTVEASMIGFAPRREDITVTGDSDVVLVFRLEEASVPLGEVVVTPGRFAVMASDARSTQTLDHDDIQNLPQLGEDIYRAVRRLPGLAGNDYAAQFHVRGGEYREVLVRVDGMTLYDPFHLKDIGGGALSILDVEAIGGIDMMTGAFPAEYGDRMSGVFDVTTLTPPPGTRRTTVGISFTNTRFSSQGRFADDRGEWLVMARRGYLDLVFSILEEEDAPRPTYYDVLGKTKYRLNDRHSLALHVLVANDDLDWSEDEDVAVTGYGNSYGWLTWDALLSARLFARTLVSAGLVTTERDGEDISTNDGALFFHVEDERSFGFAGVRQDWTFDATPHHQLKGGWEVRRLAGSYDYFNRDRTSTQIVDGELVVTYDTTRADLEPKGTQASAYASHRFRPWTPLTVEWGLRYDRATWTDDATWSPRINAALRLGRRTALRLGWGWFHQVQGLHEMQVQDGDARFYPSERAEHRVLGLEHALRPGTQLRAEVYQKKLTDLRPRFINLTDASTEFFPEARNDRVRVDADEGQAYGIELYARHDAGGHVTWAASYGYSVTEAEVGGQTYPRGFDQRHTVYLDVGWRPTPAWRLNAAWQFHSGWPYTTRTFSLETDGEYWWIASRYGDYNGERFPAYHRLDVRVHRYFTFGRSRLAVFLEVSNLYNRANVRSYDYSARARNGLLRVQRSPNEWLPRLPSIGVSWEITH